MEKAAVILKLLGDKTRLTIMKLIDNQACCVCEFVEIFQVSQPSISQHLRKLKDLGLVKEERKGQWIFYSVDKENEYYSFIKPILDQLPNQDYKLKELEENGTNFLLLNWRYYFVYNAYTRNINFYCNPSTSNMAAKRLKHWLVRDGWSCNCLISRGRRIQ